MKNINDNKPKEFIVTHANSNTDIHINRDELISNILGENTKREYSFSLNPKYVGDSPTILILQSSTPENYYQTLIESTVTLSSGTFNALKENLSHNSDCQLTDTLCEMSEIMDIIINSDSWESKTLSDSDKSLINSKLESLKVK